MIDTTKEETIALTILAQGIPNRAGGKGINVCTLSRWTTRGVRGIKLESIMVGGSRCSSREALARFFAGVTAAANQESLPAEDRQTAIDAANQRLDEAGII